MTTPGADAFIRQLDQDPELLEQVRARILTRELLQLPETVAQLAAAQQETVRHLDSLRTGEEQINSRLYDLTTSVQNLQGNLGNLTGYAYENRAARLAPRLLAPGIALVTPGRADQLR